MSCHGTPGNRAATSIACALTHTPSDEVSRRFHQLKREGSDTPAPSPEQTLEWLERQSLAIRNDETLSAWRKERLLAAIEGARTATIAGELPDGPTWHSWQNIRAACDEAHVHTWLAETAGLNVPITEAQPKEIDEKLADLWARINRERDLKRLKERDLVYARRNVGRYGITEDAVLRREQAVEESEAKLEALIDETAPYEREHARRGGWSRYFRVITSGEGHVHASMSCHSCYPTTTYVWLPSLSGQGEEEAVDEYGSEMCSHCFPSVLSHPRYQSRGRVAEAAAAARAAERAEREAVKAAKAITSPDGSPLAIGGGRYPEIIQSAVTAERTLVRKLAELQTDLSEEGRAASLAQHISWGGGRPSEEYSEILSQRADQARQDAERLIAALAHKRGTTGPEIESALAQKVNQMVRKIRRAQRPS